MGVAGQASADQIQVPPTLPRCVTSDERPGGGRTRDVVLPPASRASDRPHASGRPLGFRVSGFGFRVSGFGFRVSGFGFRMKG